MLGMKRGIISELLSACKRGHDDEHMPKEHCVREAAIRLEYSILTGVDATGLQRCTK